MLRVWMLYIESMNVVDAKQNRPLQAQVSGGVVEDEKKRTGGRGCQFSKVGLQQWRCGRGPAMGEQPQR